MLANVFNPDSDFFNDLEYVQKTAERACSQAVSAFGPGDPIHVEALLNLALFHWLRRRNPAQGEVSLSEAVRLLAAGHGEHPSLLTELLAALVLVHLAQSRKDLPGMLNSMAFFGWPRCASHTGQCGVAHRS